MKIKIEDSTGIDTIESDDFVEKSWNDVYDYCQKILDSKSITCFIFENEQNTDKWTGKDWLEYFAQLKEVKK